MRDLTVPRQPDILAPLAHTIMDGAQDAKEAIVGKYSLDPTDVPDIMSGVTATAVIPFPKPRQGSPARCVWTERVQMLAHADSRYVLMHAATFQRSLEELDVDMRSALEVLRNGKCVKGPYQDRYGDWRGIMRRKVAGRRVYIEVALRSESLVCIAAKEGG